MSYLDLFHYQITGPEAGRRWVFVHGLMGYSANWRKIVSGLEGTERVLVYDQRGHGRSMKPDTGYTPEDYSEDLYKITTELGWDRFILVGHSMGGRNVTNFAYRYPEKLSHLVVEDIGLETAENAVEYYENLLGLVPTPFANRDEARRFFQTEFREKAKTRDSVDVLAQFFYANMEDQPNGTVDWRFSKKGILQTVIDGRAKDRWHEVEALKMPTLWVRGENSQELSRENFARISKSNPMITGVEIPNAGHWIHADQPALFLQALKDFVGGF
jgi:pimeloyl-ACP methyl ester carboxylesterase